MVGGSLRRMRRNRRTQQAHTSLPPSSPGSPEHRNVFPSDEPGFILEGWIAMPISSVSGTVPRDWDVIVVGGGASGLSVAFDAATRGYRTLLLEQSDFAKATSSRSTKLIHGGVRYLKQGNISLVRESLHERGRLLRNAPNLVRAMPFVVPGYHWWEPFYYTLGLKTYDFLAGKLGIERSRFLSGKKTLEWLPGISPQGLNGGTLYYDAQFDDARLALAFCTQRQRCRRLPAQLRTRHRSGQVGLRKDQRRSSHRRPRFRQS